MLHPMVANLVFFRFIKCVHEPIYDGRDMDRLTDPLAHPGAPKRRAGAEGLDEPLRLAAPRLWLIGLAVVCLLVAALVLILS